MDQAVVLLLNPKFPHNVGGALRACAAFGADRLYWTGDRVPNVKDSHVRLPREERFKGYRHVVSHPLPDPSSLWAGGWMNDRQFTVVAVELLPGAEPLTTFVHPAKAVYIFGPEDGGVPKTARAACHRFVMVPARFCLNLVGAVNVVLYDRLAKRITAGRESQWVYPEMLLDGRGRACDRV